MASSHTIVSDPFTVTLIRIKARQLCRRSDFTRSDREDLEQAMRLYLLKKAALFDPARGNLEAFVTHALNTWVAMELRYRHRGKRRASYRAVSLEGTPVECEGEVTSLVAMLMESDGNRRTQADSLTPMERLDLRNAIEHVMARLSPEDRTLVTSVAEHGIRATARTLGISWRQVSNTLARIRRGSLKAFGLD